MGNYQNTIKQRHDVKGGTLQLILSTSHPLTSNELGDLETITAACAMYADRWPQGSEFLAEARESEGGE